MVGRKVKVVGTGKQVMISEIELINGVEIFYMSDGTSCDSSKFELLTLEELVLEKIILTKKEIASNIAKSFLEHSNKKKLEEESLLKTDKPKTFKMFGWTITFSKSK
jgi:hypothetical protein